jgi:hypothetical protein
MFSLPSITYRLTARPVTVHPSPPAYLPTDPPPIYAQTEPMTVGLYVGHHGSVRVITADGADVTFENVPDASFINIAARYVVTPTVSGPHASGIVALLPYNQNT